MKKLGVIGGLGPMATVHFLEMVTEFTDAGTDQEHIPMIVMSVPDTPDRTAYILDRTRESPLPKLTEAGRTLKNAGAEYLAIPCVTAHYFYRELCDAIGLPIVSLPVELGLHFRERGVGRVGILATDGTVRSGFLQEVLGEYGIEAVIPDREGQAAVMDTIYGQVKASKPVNHERFAAVGEGLKAKGAEGLLLGCTELSLVKRERPALYREPYVDALEVLARAAVKYSKERISYAE